MARDFRCHTCPAAASSAGELEEHLLTRSGHHPADPAHQTPRVRQRQQRDDEHHAILVKLADLLDTTPGELIQAIRKGAS